MAAPQSKKRVLVVITNEAFIPSREQQLQQQQVLSAQPGQFDPESYAYLQPQTAPPVPSASTAPAAPPAHNKHYTGVDVYELMHIWQLFREQLGLPVDFASPRGGPAAADPLSMERVRKDEKMRRQFDEDRELIDAIGHTYPLDWIRPEDYVCVVIPGERGAMLDLPECRQLELLLAAVHEHNQGLICTIGHGAAALLNIRKPNSAEFLVRNRKLTCFSNSEERELGMDKLLPFSLEDRLKERGARIETADPNRPKVIVDERLITAQNPQSVRDFVQKIAENIQNSKLCN